MSLTIRPEADADNAAIREVLLAAFPTAAEADLVTMLHSDLDSEIALVAAATGGIVGQALLSRMGGEGDGRGYRAVGLGPGVVRPDRQRRGIGSALIRDALARAERRGEELVFVVGEPGYYRRFGFSNETAAPFGSPYAGRYFMARQLREVELPAWGRARYAPAFEGLG